EGISVVRADLKKIGISSALPPASRKSLRSPIAASGGAQPKEPLEERAEHGEHALLFSLCPPLAENRDTGGSTLVIAVPVVWIAPSGKAVSMKVRVSSVQARVPRCGPAGPVLSPAGVPPPQGRAGGLRLAGLPGPDHRRPPPAVGPAGMVLG